MFWIYYPEFAAKLAGPFSMWVVLNRVMATGTIGFVTDRFDHQISHLISQFLKLDSHFFNHCFQVDRLIVGHDYHGFLIRWADGEINKIGSKIPACGFSKNSNDQFTKAHTRTRLDILQPYL